MAILTDAQISAIREELQSISTKDESLSDRKIGLEIGFSPAVVNSFKNNKYAGDNTKVAAAVKSFIDRYNNPERADNKGKLKFAPTSASLKIFETVKYCINKSKIGLITGEPGLGKTISLEEYCLRNTSAIIIYVVPIANVRWILEDISKALRLPIQAYKGNQYYNLDKPAIFRQIVEALKDTSLPIILDEGENLSTSCLEIIRRIHDLTNAPMILAGTSRLEHKLRGERGQFKQLYSRVGIHEQIRSFSQKDVASILEVNFPEALNFASTFLQVSKQNGRLLQNLIDLVKINVQKTGESISTDLIDLAAESLLK